MLNDQEILMNAIADGTVHDVFIKANPTLLNDKEFVSMGVAHYGLALEFVSPTLKNDKDVVLLAVAEFGMALKFASSDLKNDRTVVLQAVTQDKDTIAFASPAIQGLCAGKNPIKALQASILADELMAEMKPKPEQIQKPKLKI